MPERLQEETVAVIPSDAHKPWDTSNSRLRDVNDPTRISPPQAWLDALAEKRKHPELYPAPLKESLYRQPDYLEQAAPSEPLSVTGLAEQISKLAGTDQRQVREVLEAKLFEHGEEIIAAARNVVAKIPREELDQLYCDLVNAGVPEHRMTREIAAKWPVDMQREAVGRQLESLANRYALAIQDGGGDEKVHQLFPYLLAAGEAVIAHQARLAAEHENSKIEDELPNKKGVPLTLEQARNIWEKAGFPEPLTDTMRQLYAIAPEAKAVIGRGYAVVSKLIDGEREELDDVDFGSEDAIREELLITSEDAFDDLIDLPGEVAIANSVSGTYTRLSGHNELVLPDRSKTNIPVASIYETVSVRLDAEGAFVRDLIRYVKGNQGHESDEGSIEIMGVSVTLHDAREAVGELVGIVAAQKQLPELDLIELERSVESAMKEVCIFPEALETIMRIEERVKVDTDWESLYQEVKGSEGQIFQNPADMYIYVAKHAKDMLDTASEEELQQALEQSGIGDLLISDLRLGGKGYEDIVPSDTGLLQEARILGLNMQVLEGAPRQDPTEVEYLGDAYATEVAALKSSLRAVRDIASNITHTDKGDVTVRSSNQESQTLARDKAVQLLTQIAKGLKMDVGNYGITSLQCNMIAEIADRAIEAVNLTDRRFRLVLNTLDIMNQAKKKTQSSL